MEIVLNKKEFQKSGLRKDALKIIESAYKSITPFSFVNESIKLSGSKFSVLRGKEKKVFNLDDFRTVNIVGFGKGALATVSELARVLGKRFSDAYVIDVKGYCSPKKHNPKIKAFFGTHPKPSMANVKATREIADFLESLREDDFVIFVVCGGGSSLLCGTEDEMKYSSKVFELLTRKGANIKELNTVRKHLSGVKGGWLSLFAYPATSISLFVSDVLGNDISMIASGPTVYDKTTKKDAERILREYLNIRTSDVQKLIRALTETPKDKKYFKKCSYALLASNKNAVCAMVKKCNELGYKTRIGSLETSGDSHKVFDKYVKSIKKGEAIIFAGETSLKITGNGEGGRNQESCLYVLKNAIDKKVNLKDKVVCSIASDGYDNTSAAGAFVDELVLESSIKKNISPEKFLKNNDSYNFFKKTGGHIFVNQQSLNISDLMFILRK